MPCTSTYGSVQNSSRIECVIQKVRRVLGSTYFGNHRIENLCSLVVCLATFPSYASPLTFRRIMQKCIVQCCLCFNIALACSFITCTPFHIADTIGIGCIECECFGQATCPSVLNSNCSIHYLSHADKRK